MRHEREHSIAGMGMGKGQERQKEDEVCVWGEEREKSNRGAVKGMAAIE